MDWLAGQLSLGNLLALVAIAVAVATFLSSRKRASFCYRVIGKTKVVTIAPLVEAEIQVLFRGERVTGLTLFLIEVKNDGGIPLTADAFTEPFSIFFGEDAQVLVFNLIQVMPDELEPRLASSGPNLRLKPFLLNPGDKFVVSSLVKDAGNYRHQGRIVGVKQILDKSGDNPKPVSWERICFGAAGLLLATSSVYLATPMKYRALITSTSHWLSHVALGAIAIALTIQIVRRR